MCAPAGSAGCLALAGRSLNYRPILLLAMLVTEHSTVDLVAVAGRDRLDNWSITPQRDMSALARSVLPLWHCSSHRPCSSRTAVGPDLPCATAAWVRKQLRHADPHRCSKVDTSCSRSAQRFLTGHDQMLTSDCSYKVCARDVASVLQVHHRCPMPGHAPPLSSRLSGSLPPSIWLPNQPV